MNKKNNQIKTRRRTTARKISLSYPVKYFYDERMCLKFHVTKDSPKPLRNCLRLITEGRVEHQLQAEGGDVFLPLEVALDDSFPLVPWPRCNSQHIGFLCFLLTCICRYRHRHRVADADRYTRTDSHTGTGTAQLQTQ